MTDRIDIPADEHEDIARMLHALGDEPLPGDVAVRLDNVLAAQRPLVARPARPRFGIRLAPLLAAASVIVVVGLVYAVGRDGTPGGDVRDSASPVVAQDAAAPAESVAAAGDEAVAAAEATLEAAATEAAAAAAAPPNAEKTTAAAEAAGATDSAAQDAGAAEPAAPAPSDVSAADLFALVVTPFGSGRLDPLNDPALAPFNAAVAADNAWQAANDLLNRSP